MTFPDLPGTVPPGPTAPSAADVRRRLRDRITSVLAAGDPDATADAVLEVLDEVGLLRAAAPPPATVPGGGPTDPAGDAGPPPVTSEAAVAARGWIDADWLVTARSARLHHAVLDDEQAVALIEDGGLPDTAPVRLACGRPAVWVAIPGLFSRMGAARCTRCCRAVGCPPGVGSPKNDQGCADWLARRRAASR